MQGSLALDVAPHPASPDAVAPHRAAAPDWPPRTAVVLAAGRGSRRRVAGLGLLERSLLTLRAAGMGDLRVVDGPEPDPVVSSEVGALAGGFLVAAADHLIDTAFARGFLARAAARPHDAQVAPGLLYVPPGGGRAIGDLLQSGAGSLADLASALAASRKVVPLRVDEGVSHPAGAPAAAREAERRLLRSLAKSSDGFVSRHLNRRISIALSRYLARWGVRPNAITTAVFLVSLAGAFMAQTGAPLWLAAGGILFQLASILDGCDGEVARLKFQGTRWGGWYDTVSDNIRYMVFYAALGVAAFRISGAEIYLWALVPFLALSIFFVATMARYTLSTQTHYTNLAVTSKVLSADRTRWWERLVLPLSGLVKQDVQAFIAMLFCLVGLPGPYFWLTLAAAVMMTVSVVRGLGGEGTAGARARVFLFYSGGLLLLAWLASRMPLWSLEASFSGAGAGVLLAFATAPLWYAANAFGIGLLLDGRVGFRHLFHNQVVGEAMNTIVPLAGLGGDVFRVRHLAGFVGTPLATRAVVQDRLVHALSGPLFAGAAIAITLWLVPLEPAVATGLGLTAALLLAAGAALLAFMLTPWSTRWSAALVRRLSRSPGGVTFEPPRRRLVLAVLAAKLVGRALNLIEIAVILRILGLEAGPALVIAIAGLLSASAVVFFMVPQGLGVNEAGIAGAFTLVGVGAPHGLAFGLIRRARVVTWAALGLALQASVWGWKRLRPRRREEAALADGA